MAASGMVLQVILAGYGYFSSMQPARPTSAFAPYPLFWVGAPDARR